MSLRTRRHKKTGKISLPTGTFLKVRLIPWLYTTNGCVWLASMAVGRSNRQINDWMKRRKNVRARRLDMNLTGKDGNLCQALAVRFLRECQELVPGGDSICFRCESAKAKKQFKVWKRWFARHETGDWQIDEETKSFFFYKKKH